MGYFVMAMALVVLVSCWLFGDVQVLTKVIFTVLYLASFGLLFIPSLPFLFLVAQIILIAVIGGATFGLEWLSQRH